MTTWTSIHTAMIFIALALGAFGAFCAYKGGQDKQAKT